MMGGWKSAILFVGYWCIVGYMYYNVIFLGCIIPFALWKIFKKAGEKGWKSIIPIYDMAVANKIIGISPWLALLSLVSFIAVIPYYGHSMLVLFQIGGLIELAFMDFYVNYKLSKSFGHKWPFALGLIFVSFVFYPILAFGKSQYVGPKPKENPNSQTLNPKNAEIEKIIKIVLSLIIVLIILFLILFGILYDTRRAIIPDVIEKATDIVFGKSHIVKYGQTITFDDLIDTDELPENITVSISINGTQLSENQTFTFNRLGKYKIIVRIEYIDDFGRVLKTTPPFYEASINMNMNDRKKSFIIEENPTNITESLFR